MERSVLGGRAEVVQAAGAGTHAENGVCVPNATTAADYELRVAVPQIPADGITKVPVLAIGRRPIRPPAGQPSNNTARRPRPRCAGAFTSSSRLTAPSDATA